MSYYDEQMLRLIHEKNTLMRRLVLKTEYHAISHLNVFNASSGCICTCTFYILIDIRDKQNIQTV